MPSGSGGSCSFAQPAIRTEPRGTSASGKIFDLHLAARLLAKGCPAETALRILL
jgi:hypothetical protein